MPNHTQTHDEQVSWQVDGIDVYATLTRPVGAGPFPAVLFIAGSGPTDRDWNTPLLPGTNGSAALLAQELTSRGFVTLRYDKRASGPHVQENLPRMIGKISMQAHTDETVGGVRLLAAREDVDPRRLFVLANSEGCIHAVNYQMQARNLPFAGIILTAPPARPMGAVARAQIAAQVSAIPGGEAWLAAYDAAIADFIANRPVNVPTDLPEGIRMLLIGLTNPVNQPFSGELWATDLMQALRRIQQPVLVVIGKKDIQVDWQADGSLVSELAKTHSNIRVVFPENANHVLKFEPLERAQINPAQVSVSYNAEGARLDEDALRAILDWLKNQL